MQESALEAAPTSQGIPDEHAPALEEGSGEREERQARVSEDVLEERAAEETGTSSVVRTRADERGTFGVDFAELTDQRQLSLSERKKQMLQNARK